MANRSSYQDSEKTFYEGFWQTQIALSCDEKCRMRFILSEVKRFRNSLAAASQVPAATPAIATTAHAQRAGLTRDASPAQGNSTRLRIADVGCGRGWLTQLLSRFGDAVGFDRSTTEARKRYPEGRFVECNVLELLPDNFDLAVCSEVIEHVRAEEQPRLIKSLLSILRPGGGLIMTTPNRPQVSRLIGELSLQQELQPVEDWLDAEALKEVVATCFEIEKAVTVMFFPIALRKIGPLSRLYRAVYEQMNGYCLVDPLFQRTKLGLYIGLAGRKRAEAPTEGNSEVPTGKEY